MKVEEMSAMSAGAVAGAPSPCGKKEKNDHLIDREKLIAEMEEENTLREVIRYAIRKVLSEAAIPNTPHFSTGINTLEDLLKKIIPVIKDDYKDLTTSEEQRMSFRSHIIKAVEDTLAPLQVVDDVDEELEEEELTEDDTYYFDFGSELLEEEEAIDVNIDVDAEDIDVGEDKFIDIEETEPEVEDAFGIPGEDVTGRNFAEMTFKKVEKQIADAFGLLSNPEDQEVFSEYLVTNLKLYFDKFENELQAEIEEPTTPSYEEAEAEEEVETEEEFI